MFFALIHAIIDSWNAEQFRSRNLLNRLRNFARDGTIMCGIDTGAFVLAQAGLLNGCRAVVHYEHMAAFGELFPSIKTKLSCL